MLTATETPATPAAEQPPPIAAGDEGTVPPVIVPEATPTTPAEIPVVPSKVERAEAAAAKARAGAKRNKAVMGELTRERAERARLETERAELSKRAERAAEFEARAKNDPLGLAKELGLTPDQLAQKMLEDGTPDAKIAALEQKFSRELEETRAENRRLRDERDAEKRAVAVGAVEQAFVKSAGNATKYPNLAKQPSGIVLAAAKEVLRTAAADPRTKSHSYSDDEVLSFLESQYAKNATPSPKDASESSQGSGPSEKSNPAPSRTITNKLASAKFSKVSSFDDLDDDEQKELMAEQLRQKLGRRT